MKYLTGTFLISAEKLSQCPDYILPEFPLLGRSNVGKSSFINALANNKKLAKTSNTKTYPPRPAYCAFPGRRVPVLTRGGRPALPLLAVLP